MNTRQMGVFLFVAILLVSLVACAWPGLPTSDPLEGTSWRLTTLAGASLIPGTEITATFEEGQVSGRACNSYGGKYQVSGDRLTISEVFATEMACVDPQGVIEQEQVYLRLLTGAQSFSLTGGRLSILTASGEELTFAPTP
jgi:heat shock protein HslJ